MAGIGLASAALLGVLLRDSGAGWAALPLLLAAVLIPSVLLPLRRGLTLGLLALALAGLGAWRAAPPTQTVTPGQSLTIESGEFVGKVLGVPRRTSSAVYARVSLRSPAAGDADVVLPPYSEVSEGDILRFAASVSDASGASAAAERREAVPVLYARRVTILASEATAPQRVRTSVRRLVDRRVKASVPEPAGSLASGLLLGDDSGMTVATRDAFRAAGLSHITAISGWNIAVIAGLFATLGRRGGLPAYPWLIPTTIGLWSFAYLVGMGPSVTRATLMGSLYLLARWRGRPGDTITALVWASVAMVLMSPGIRFDVGFQLSVASTLGIAAVVPRLERYPRCLGLIVVPVVAQVSVAPLLLHHFGTYSLIAPLANLPVAPLVILAVAGAASVAAAATIHPLAGEALGLLAWVPARLIVGIAEWSAKIPWVSGQTVSLSWNATVLLYAALIGACAWIALQPRPLPAEPDEPAPAPFD